MKPAKFEYHAPASIDEALALLVRYQGDARLLAGGQSLVPMMNFRVVAPAALVDLNRIAALDYIMVEDDVVRIGAMTRQRKLEFSPVIAATLPLLRDAIKWVGHLPTRSRGTIGGSIAHADPSAEIPMVLQTLEGEVVARGPQSERRIKAADLFQSSLTTSLEPDEILTEIRLPVMPAKACWAIEEFARRQGDFAIAAIAVTIIRDGAHCAAARLGTAGIAASPARLIAAEEILERKGLGEAAIEEAAAAAAATVEALSDQNASAEFRRHLTHVLVRRAVENAIGRKGHPDVATG